MRRAISTLVLLGAALACTGPQPALHMKPVSLAVLEDYDKGADLGEIAKDFALMRELDVRTWRGSFGWDDYEPEPGVYDFAWLRRFVELAAREGITLRPYVGYTPAWAAAGGSDDEAWNDPPASLDRWATFLHRLAEELDRHPNVLSLEIYNEQNVRQWWDGSVETYARLFQRSLLEATVLPIFPGGLVYPDGDWFERACGEWLGNPLPAVAFHAYPETWTPPGVTVENYLGDGFDGFVDTVDRACGRSPIWINETGFATTPGRTELQQAHWWARAFATFLSEPRVEQIGIYEIKDLPAGSPVIGDAPNYHLGITRADRTPKLAFRAVDVLSDLLDTGTLGLGDRWLSVTPDDPSVRRHLFVRPDGRMVLFLWTTGSAPASVTATVSRTPSSTVEQYLDGTSAPVAMVDGRLPDVRLEPGIVRIFVIYEGG